MKKLLFCLLFLVWVFEGQCQIVGPPEWFMLPFPIGKTYVCSQGNYDDPSTKKVPNETHTNNPARFKTMIYAFDFDMDWGDKIVAPAPCKVVKVMGGGNWNNGFGNLVVVAYNDGTYGRFCHMADEVRNKINYSISVKETQLLSRGQLIGFCGNTGNCITSPGGDGSHLHYQKQISPEPYGPLAQSISTNFVEVGENGGRPIKFGRYTSLNSYNSSNLFSVGAFSDGWKVSRSDDFLPSSAPFAIYYDFGGDTAVFGYLQSEVHQYPRDFSTVYEKPWCQDFLYIGKNSRNDYIMILNPYQVNPDIGFKGVCYVVGGAIRLYWMANFEHLGVPASQEYSWEGIGVFGTKSRYPVQWFQKNDKDWIGVVYENSKCYEIKKDNPCYDPVNIFSGTGQIFCAANCASGGGEGDYGMESDSVADTGNTVPPDTSHSITYPFQVGFKPVNYGNFTYDGLVFGLRRDAGDGCQKMYDTGSVFPPNSGNIWCVLQMSNISGSFLRKMVIYQNNAYWWEAKDPGVISTGTDVWPCAALPISADCFNKSGNYQIEVSVSHNGKIDTLAKRNLTISGSSSILFRPTKDRSKLAGPVQVFDLGGREISNNQRRRGVFLIRSGKDVLRMRILVR